MLEAVVVSSGHVGKYISRKDFKLEFCKSPTKKGITIKTMITWESRGVTGPSAAMVCRQGNVALCLR